MDEEEERRLLENPNVKAFIERARRGALHAYEQDKAAQSEDVAHVEVRERVVLRWILYLAFMLPLWAVIVITVRFGLPALTTLLEREEPAVAAEPATPTDHRTQRPQ